MSNSLINRLGDWNPQIFRELKGRFRLRNIIPVVLVSILVQALIIGSFWLQLPIPASPLNSEVTAYPAIQLESTYQADRHPFIYDVDFFKIPSIPLNRSALIQSVNIRAQDVLVAIDGVPVPIDNGNGVDTYNLLQQINSPKPGGSRSSTTDLSVVGTTVTLTLIRPSEPALGEFEVELTRVLRSDVYSRYCLQDNHNSNRRYSSRCELFDPDTLKYKVNWQQWYADVFYAYGWLITIGLLVIGLFMLANNLEYENQLGTLNFIRLSPLASQDVLIGKILGVPCLVYLAALLCLPAQHWFGLQAGLPLGLLLLHDLVVLLGLVFWYCLGLVSSLLVPWRSGLQPWLWSVLAFLCTLAPLGSTYGDDLNDVFDLFTPTTLLIHLHAEAVTTTLAATDSPHADSFLIATINLWWIGAIVGGTLLWFGVWFWLALNRRFQSPTASLLSKPQSYLFTLGFELATVTTATVLMANSNFRFVFLMLANLFLGFGLMVMLAGQRQPLIDWARFRHRQAQGVEQVVTDEATAQLAPPRRTSIWADLLWGDRSPSTLAIAVNLAIAGLFIGGWQSLYILLVESTQQAGYYTITPSGSIGQTLQAVFLNLGTKAPDLWFHGLQLLHGLGSILALVIFVQIILLWRVQSRAVWALAFVAANLFLPFIAAVMLQDTLPFMWVFSPLGWVEAPSLFANVALELSVGLQVLTIAIGSFFLWRSLHKLGTSELKELTAAQGTVV